MEFGEYQRKAYAAIQPHNTKAEEEMHWAIGLGGEVGEVQDVIKHRHYGNIFSLDDLVAELGDVLWNLSAICSVFGISLDDVAMYNIMKMEYRYPDGVFDEERVKIRHELDAQFAKLDEVVGLMDKIRAGYVMVNEKGAK